MTKEQREQVRRLRAQGKGYKRIGGMLGIPVGTVKSFCRREAGEMPPAPDGNGVGRMPVSYTHLDVYKRQAEHAPGDVEIPAPPDALRDATEDVRDAREAACPARRPRQ